MLHESTSAQRLLAHVIFRLARFLGVMSNKPKDIWDLTLFGAHTGFEFLGKVKIGS
jgi:hypothetical protein